MSIHRSEDQKQRWTSSFLSLSTQHGSRVGELSKELSEAHLARERAYTFVEAVLISGLI